MHTVTKQFRAEIAHRLPGHLGACQYLHGHSYLFEVSVSSDALNRMGMVVDFKDLKEAMEKVIGPWDHSTVLHSKDPLVSVLAEQKGVRLLIVPFIPTAENMAKYVAEEANRWLPNEVYVTGVRVWETSTSYADWRPKCF